jgi:hypothetical protein
MMPGAIGPESVISGGVDRVAPPGLPYAAEGPSIHTSTPARRREVTGTNDSNFSPKAREQDVGAREKCRGRGDSDLIGSGSIP